MKNHIFVTLVIILMVLAVLPTTGTTTTQQSTNKGTEDTLKEIQQAIRDNNAEWTAGYTSVFGPDASIELCDCGCIDTTINVEDIVEIQFSGTLPEEFDWRNVDGLDWTTSVKNQRSCGSCVAFGTIGALEAVVQIEMGEIFDCDLSEAHLFFCGGGKCDGGWYTDDAAQFVKNTGVVDELCFPYESHDMDCNEKASNWRNRVIKVQTKGAAHNERDIKEALVEYGPLFTAFDVCDDFFSYRGGIYQHVSGDYSGGHCVMLVGYSDEDDCWICKNSWGEGWGEKNPYDSSSKGGWFRIKYRECDICEYAYFFDGVFGNIQPMKPENLSPYDGEKYVDPEPTFTWNPCEDLDGDEVYYNVYLSDSSNIRDDDIVANHISSSTFQVPTLEKGTIYYWKIVSEDEHGAQHQSETHKFYTRAPCQPDVQGPSSGRPNLKYTFTASTTDTHGEEYYWFFYWGDDSNSGWLGPYGPGEEVKASHSWTEKDDYQIKVRYKEDDTISDWTILSFTIPKNKAYLLIYHYLNDHPTMLKLFQQLIPN